MSRTRTISSWSASNVTTRWRDGILVEPGEDLGVHLRDASGVRTSPSRSGSSPIAARISRTARSIRSVSIGYRRLVLGTDCSGVESVASDPPERRVVSDWVAAAALLRLAAACAPAGRRVARSGPSAVASRIRTSAKSSCTRSASSVSCRISSAASWSRISRLSVSTRSADAWRRRSGSAPRRRSGRDLFGVVGGAVKSRPRNTSPCG